MVQKPFHANRIDNGSVSVLYVASQFVLVRGEELGMASHWEAEDLGHDSSDALISGHDGNSAGLGLFELVILIPARVVLSTVLCHMKPFQEFGRKALTIFAPALPPIMMILSGSAPSELAFSFDWSLS